MRSTYIFKAFNLKRDVIFVLYIFFATWIFLLAFTMLLFFHLVFRITKYNVYRLVLFVGIQVLTTYIGNLLTFL